MTNPYLDLTQNQISLTDDRTFLYTVKPYEFTNALGHMIAVLKEYHFIERDSNSGEFSWKLYKTKDGNWYDLDETNSSSEKAVLRMLKSAIDAQENNCISHAGLIQDRLIFASMFSAKSK